MTETQNPYDFIEGRKVMVSEDAYVIKDRLVESSKEAVRGKVCFLTRFPFTSSSYGRYTAIVVTGENGTWSMVDAACLSHPTPAYGTPDSSVAAESDAEVEDEVAEPTHDGARVSYYDDEDDEWYVIDRIVDGRWRLEDSLYSETWKFFIEDARPGTIRVVN